MSKPPLFARRTIVAAGLGLAASAGVGRAAVMTLQRHVFRTDPFTLGVAAGDPAPDGFVIWTRLAPNPLMTDGDMPPIDVPVAWEIAEDPQFRRIALRGEGRALATLAHAVHVEVAGLLPQRPYWYRFVAPGNLVSPVGTARTLPATGTNVARVRIASVGCQNFERGYYTAYRHLSEERDIDAVFHYGDYIYEFAPRADQIVRRHWGGETLTLDDYRLRYSQYKLDRDLQAAHASAAFIMSFDDHEIDDNWAGDRGKDGGQRAEFAARKTAAFQAWYEHVPVRRRFRPDVPGGRSYRRFDFGTLMRMHVLDTRSFRSPQLCEAPDMSRADQSRCRPNYAAERTMLGAEQEAWLGRGLDNAMGWNFVAQQVLMMTYDARKDGETKPRIGTDNWGGYPHARRRFIDAVAQRGLTNVVIGSGDMHQNLIGALPSRPEDPTSKPIASEFLATSITSNGTGGARYPGEEHALDYNPNVKLLNNQRGYHLYSVDRREWQADVRVVDQVHRPDGVIVTLARFAVDPREPGPQSA